MLYEMFQCFEFLDSKLQLNVNLSSHNENGFIIRVYPLCFQEIFGVIFSKIKTNTFGIIDIDQTLFFGKYVSDYW